MPRNILCAAFLGAAALMAGPAFADYPERPVTVILPHNPGGGGEIGMRTWQPFMEACLGQPLTITPRPGAGAALGIGEAASATPDGYTIGSLTMPNLISQSITTQAPYTIDSFDYLGNFMGSQSTFAVSVNSKFKTLADFVDYAKTATGPVNIAVAGVGNDDHLTGLKFAQLSGLKITFIPFGDGALVRNSLLGGHADVAIMNNTLVAQFKEEIRPLAIAAKERNPTLPDTPTFKESGYDMTGGSHHLLGVVKGAPPEVATKWRDCIQTVAKDPAFLESAAKRFVPLDIMDGAQTEAFVREQDKILRDIWAASPWQ